VNKHGKIVGRGKHEVAALHDPSAHAEIMAIREACRLISSSQLEDCVLYSSCEPCPMCLGAAMWAGIGEVVFAATRAEASEAGFNDSLIHNELAKKESERTIRMRHIRS